ncbi:MAG: AraC family transcriptional regulator [Treponema sp.]|nr:AraC family transcriptional regulator [Treponema sp.]
MDWVNRINEVIEYTENNLSEEIDKEKIGKIMACPYSVFQRSFVQIAGITLGEYIRQRKLTKAAYDILNSGERIIDIALKYGYESADAFTVAFKKLHGVSPSAVRKPEVNLKFYSRLRFTLSIKRAEEMDYKVVEKEAFKVIGRRRVTSPGGQPGNRGTWGVARKDGSVDQMIKMMEDGKPFLGLCFGFGEDRSDDNMVGIEWGGDDVEGLESYTYPKSKWLVFNDEGKIDEGILLKMWDRIYRDFLPQSEYKQANLPTIEIYTERDEERNFCKLEVWIPILN